MKNKTRRSELKITRNQNVLKITDCFVYEDIELDDFFLNFAFGDGRLKHYCLRTASLAELMTLAG